MKYGLELNAASIFQAENHDIYFYEYDWRF